MADYVIATIKSWNIENSRRLMENHPSDRFTLVTRKEQLTTELLEQIRPRFVFFPHWSWIIPKDIYAAYECVVFHMTDLPFGRGGSPLQNLVSRGIYDTKISAIRVDAGVDTGPVYMKEPLSLETGNADEMFTRASEIVFERMIPRFLEGSPVPVPQEGEAVTFPRRTPEMSAIPDGLEARVLYDHIRMLDGEGYPPAYRDEGGYRICYTNASLDGEIVRADATWHRR